MTKHQKMASLKEAYNKALENDEIDILSIREGTLEAFQRAQQASVNGVLCIQDGWVVRVKKDGSIERIEPSKPKHKVKIGETIAVNKL